MSTQVTVTLPDDTYRRAEYLARLTGRDIADVLAETIYLSLQPLGVRHAADQPVAELSDADVLAVQPIPRWTQPRKGASGNSWRCGTRCRLGTSHRRTAPLCWP